LTSAGHFDNTDKNLEDPDIILEVTMDYLTIKEMPEDTRPRERLERAGPGALSNQELIAILLSTGTVVGARKYTALDLATQLLKTFENLKGLARADFSQLTAVAGIGPAKACQVMAAFELAKRVAIFSGETKPIIRQPTDVFEYFSAHLSLLTQEEFCVAMLDTKNRLIKHEFISKGTLNASIVHPREVFRPAVVHAAAAIIVLHNHPSGDPTPSQEDLDITRRLVEAGNIIGINLLDHLIVGGATFTSLKEMRLM
jgi:DNA repair protein RadC